MFGIEHEAVHVQNHAVDGEAGQPDSWGHVMDSIARVWGSLRRGLKSLGLVNSGTQGWTPFGHDPFGQRRAHTVSEEGIRMFSLIQVNTATLDKGIPGITPLDTALLFLLLFAVPMFPYFLFYLSLREKKAPEPAGVPHRPFAKLTGWMHMHRHPQLLHH
jgi:hypothetical protein